MAFFFGFFEMKFSRITSRMGKQFLLWSFLFCTACAPSQNENHVPDAVEAARKRANLLFQSFEDQFLLYQKHLASLSYLPDTTLNRDSLAWEALIAFSVKVNSGSFAANLRKVYEEKELLSPWGNEQLRLVLGYSAFLTENKEMLSELANRELALKNGLRAETVPFRGQLLSAETLYELLETTRGPVTTTALKQLLGQRLQQLDSLLSVQIKAKNKLAQKILAGDYVQFNRQLFYLPGQPPLQEKWANNYRWLTFDSLFIDSISFEAYHQKMNSPLGMEKLLANKDLKPSEDQLNAAFNRVFYQAGIYGEDYALANQYPFELFPFGNITEKENKSEMETRLYEKALLEKARLFAFSDHAIPEFPALLEGWLLPQEASAMENLLLNAMHQPYLLSFSNLVPARQLLNQGDLAKQFLHKKAIRWMYLNRAILPAVAQMYSLENTQEGFLHWLRGLKAENVYFPDSLSQRFFFYREMESFLQPALPMGEWAGQVKGENWYFSNVVPLLDSLQAGTSVNKEAMPNHFSFHEELARGVYQSEHYSAMKIEAEVNQMFDYWLQQMQRK